MEKRESEIDAEDRMKRKRDGKERKVKESEYWKGKERRRTGEGVE